MTQTISAWSGAADMGTAMLGQAAELGGLPPAFYLAPAGGLAALGMARFFYKSIVAHDEGDEAMVRIAAAVRKGAFAYLKAQWRIVTLVFAVLMALLAVMAFAMGLQHELTFIGVGVAGLLSGLCGFFGMKTATHAASRTAQAAKKSLNDGLRVAFRAGAVMGLCVTGFAILDISAWFFLLTQVFHVGTLAVVTTVTLSFAMGASLQALFARVGGGIYTKAADVGGDLVGKVEAGIPEDDARNPATIADNVGDNVGDVAGMGADLYESYYGAILAAMALAAAAAVRLGLDAAGAMKLVIVAPALAGVGTLASIAAMFLIRTKEGATMSDLLRALNTGVWGSSAMIVVASYAVLHVLLGDVAGVSVMGIWVAILAGLLAGLIIAKGTEVYTSYDFAPTRRIAEQAQTGPATVIISGIAEGMMSTWVAVLTTVVAVLVAFVAAGGGQVFLMGVFGVGLAAVGMLATLAITLATDAYGPIADNAGGNAEMSHQPPYVRERTDKLDSLGNTTAAIGKGFAIGSAALTALALLAAYVITVQGSLQDQVSRLGIAGVASIAKQVPQPAADDGKLNPTHLGRGVFALPRGEHIDAAILVTARDPSEVVGALTKPGAKMSSAWDESAKSFRTHLVAGERTYDFDIVPAGTASLPQIMGYYEVTLMNPRVLSGLFIGVLAVFVFCAMTMNAVGRAAFNMMQECRRQFGLIRDALRARGMSEQDIADPMKWPYSVEHLGQTYPDYAGCVEISTQGALRAMVVPSLLAVFIPVATGLLLGVAGTMGLLAGATVTGFAVAIFMANAGGSWDNCKKFVEAGNYGGKGSFAHKAAVVGDTVGDPFKDTSGPSLNILIKLMSVVSVVFAGLIVKFSPMIADLIGLG